MKLPITHLHPAAGTPIKATSGASGLDLTTTTKITLNPGEYRAIPTGLAVALPTGYALEITPRSGLAAKHGITVLNAPGLIDPDYRGEIKVILINHSPWPHTINPGDRIAQFTVKKIEPIEFETVHQLPTTQRGTNGLGSTGK